jgi:AcrR family transcriptional regulator
MSNIARTPRKSKSPRRPVNREAAKEETREALIKSAMELFPKKGLDVSLDDLCAHAGYTRGAFYVHFKNRDELGLAVMSRVGEKLLDALLGPENSSGSEDLMAIMKRFMLALVSGQYPLTKLGGLRPYQLLDACARSPAIRDKYVALTQNSIDRLARKISVSQKKKAVRSDIDADQTASLLVALVIGIHTMYDLDLPINLPKGSMTLLKLLAVK